MCTLLVYRKYPRDIEVLLYKATRLVKALLLYRLGLGTGSHGILGPRAVLVFDGRLALDLGASASLRSACGAGRRSVVAGRRRSLAAGV